MTNPEDILKDVAVETSKECVKQLAQPLYNDLAHQPLKETGNFLRNIIHIFNEKVHRAALKEDFKTMDLLQSSIASALENVDPSRLVLPKDYIFIPAMLGYSYSLDCEELRTLYAQLLAKSMVKEYQYAAHPSFIEIIKQLSPIDCRVFNEIMLSHEEIPIVHFAEILNPNERRDDLVPIIKNVTTLQSATTEQICFSIDNLSRLALISVSDAKISDESAYTPIYKTDICVTLKNNYQTRLASILGCIEKTEFGKSFFNICVCPIE